MRIALIYPPPWKIPQGEESDSEAVCRTDPDGPPADYAPGDLDPDFYQIPYGLLSLAAQALRAGHAVKVLNLSSYSWPRVEEILGELDADLFGLSCWTANRRGVALVTARIRELRPRSHIVVGGPHATPFAKEILEYFSAVDTVAVGESEATFLELVDRISSGQDTTRIAGTWYRAKGVIQKGPPRASLNHLDDLASPHEYFATHIVMTSRGCPWQCTFCGAETTWGRGFRGRSVPQVLDDLENALTLASVRMLQIKDDTFTANKRRALQICEGIVERGLRFLWSCDTRVDVLSAELLLAMRRAGCERLSLGVESGSQEILSNIDKKIRVEQIVASTELAKRYGIQVRFYMMLGNRGETLETFEETLRFLNKTQPHEYLFSCLSIYPGTLDYKAAQAEGWLSAQTYFEETFQEFKTPFDADEACTDAMTTWFAKYKGLQSLYVQGVEEAQQVAERVGDGPMVEMDLAGAHYRAGNWDEARRHAQRALELKTPVPGLAHNYLACIAAVKRNWREMQSHFSRAAQVDPQHFVLMRNVDIARRWFREGGPERELPLRLNAFHDFQLFERTVQPMLPGPMAADFAKWPALDPLSANCERAVSRHRSRSLPVVD